MRTAAIRNLSVVMAGLDPAIPLGDAPFHPQRDARVKPAYDESNILAVRDCAKARP
jgi:hypothetical protein